jgi:hypothetical protein
MKTVILSIEHYHTNAMDYSKAAVKVTCRYVQSSENASANPSLEPRLAEALQELLEQAGVDVWATSFPAD